MELEISVQILETVTLFLILIKILNLSLFGNLHYNSQKLLLWYEDRGHYCDTNLRKKNCKILICLNKSCEKRFIQNSHLKRSYKSRRAMIYGFRFVLIAYIIFR